MATIPNYEIVNITFSTHEEVTKRDPDPQASSPEKGPTSTDYETTYTTYLDSQIEIKYLGTTYGIAVSKVKGFDLVTKVVNQAGLTTSVTSKSLSEISLSSKEDIIDWADQEVQKYFTSLANEEKYYFLKDDALRTINSLVNS